MTKKRTDGGHKIPEEDLREMEQEEGREMPDGVESQTGYCRFCGQAGMVHTLTGWSQEDVDEAVTCKCECDAAKKYAKSKEPYNGTFWKHRRKAHRPGRGYGHA